MKFEHQDHQHHSDEEDHEDHQHHSDEHHHEEEDHDDHQHHSDEHDHEDGGAGAWGEGWLEEVDPSLTVVHCQHTSRPTRREKNVHI